MTQYEQETQIIKWLRNYEAYKCGIENLNELVEDIADEGMGIDYSKDQLSPSHAFSSTVENKVLKLEKLHVTDKIKTMTNTVHSLDRALSSLTDIEKAVVVNRYIKGLYYYQFCYKVCVSERTAKRIRKSALIKMGIVIFGS